MASVSPLRFTPKLAYLSLHDCPWLTTIPQEISYLLALTYVSPLFDFWVRIWSWVGLLMW